jgi:uncharacterized repeat protein (TIGR02543 family)
MNAILKVLRVAVALALVVALLVACENPSGASAGIPLNLGDGSGAGTGDGTGGGSGDGPGDGPGDTSGGSTEGQFQILLDYNGATVQNGAASLSFAPGTIVTLADLPQPQRGGLQFHGWLNSNDMDYVGTSGFEMPGYPLFLQAHWKAVLSFEPNGGSTLDPLDVILFYDEGPVNSMEIAIPVAPVRHGHTFTGWYSDEDLTQLVSAASLELSTSQTLYAGWVITTAVSPEYSHSIQFVDWLFDPPTLQVYYRKPETHAIVWDLPGLTLGEHYTIDDSQPPVTRNGLEWQVSRVLIPSRAILPENEHYGQAGTYNSEVYFRIGLAQGKSAFQVSRLLDIPPNRTPSISWFSVMNFNRTSSNGMSLSIQVWDYETRPEDLTVTINSSSTSARFFVGGNFVSTATIDHSSAVSLYGVPVQASQRSFTLALSGTAAITTTLTVTVADANGAQRVEHREITIN